MLFKEAGITGIEDINLTHHLAHDNFKVLVVNLNTLHTVNVLYLVDDILLNGCRAHDVKDIVGGDCTVGQWCAGTYIVVLLNKYLFGQGDKVFLDLAEFGGDRNFVVATFYLAEMNLTVDF